MLRWLIFLVWPFAVAAQDLPALHDVTRVASDDVLNIRAEPTATAPIIGAFAPNETNIEVLWLAPGGTWGRVRTGEQMGWSSMRFLARQPGQQGFPERLFCAGTEPFWSLDYSSFETVFEEFSWGQDTIDLPVPTRSRNDLRVYATIGRGVGSGNDAYSATFTKTACSDGMSDLDYAVSVTLMRLGSGGADVLSGCCALE